MLLNESFAYGHLKINQLRNQDNDSDNLNLDKKRRIIYDTDEKDRVFSKQSKF